MKRQKKIFRRKGTTTSGIAYPVFFHHFHILIPQSEAVEGYRLVVVIEVMPFLRDELPTGYGQGIGRIRSIDAGYVQKGVEYIPGAYRESPVVPHGGHFVSPQGFVLGGEPPQVRDVYLVIGRDR